MCNYQQRPYCGGTQKANPFKNNENICGVKNGSGTNTAASSDDGSSAATSDTVTSPTSEKQYPFNGCQKASPHRTCNYNSGCGGR